MVQIENKKKKNAQPELENMIVSVVGKTAQLLFYLQILPVHHWRNLIKTHTMTTTQQCPLFLVPVARQPYIHSHFNVFTMMTTSPQWQWSLKFVQTAK